MNRTKLEALTVNYGCDDFQEGVDYIRWDDVWDFLIELESDLISVIDETEKIKKMVE